MLHPKKLGLKMGAMLIGLAALSGCALEKPGKPTVDSGRRGVRLQGYEFTEADFFNAVRGRKYGAIKDFIVGGMNPNVVDEKGETAMVIAASENDLAGLRTLVGAGADINFRAPDKDTPLVRAARVPAPECVQYLLGQHADLNVAGEGGSLALQFFVYRNDEPQTRKALELGANPNLQDNDGDPALTTAAMKGSETLTRLLLEKGAKPNLQNKNGGSPLIYAAANGFTSVVRLLLEHGADPRLKDSKGKSPLDWAKQEDHADVVALLAARR